jgi:hypothetical protein
MTVPSAAISAELTQIATNQGWFMQNKKNKENH